MNLRPELQSAWLGEMQRELGVNASNLMLKDLVIADLEQRVETDAALIEALKKRALDAEGANVELKVMIRPERIRPKRSAGRA